ncbi:MAG TPA: BspA family leucine-rich repeat surface protein, partial [Firmicutes bacterium]|nr:BspA family leucine-rich repeat surface protein [Bacillota bacterium]
CKSLINLNVSDFDISNASIYRMFTGCENLTSLDVSKWNTSKITSMSMIFSNCKSLTSLDISKWNTSNVTNMDYMFSGCNKLTGLNLGSMNVSKVTKKTSMFSSVPSNIKITVATETLRNWVIETSDSPKLTASNFIIG